MRMHAKAARARQKGPLAGPLDRLPNPSFHHLLPHFLSPPRCQFASRPHSPLFLSPPCPRFSLPSRPLFPSPHITSRCQPVTSRCKTVPSPSSARPLPVASPSISRRLPLPFPQLSRRLSILYPPPYPPHPVPSKPTRLPEPLPTGLDPSQLPQYRTKVLPTALNCTRPL
ncbi:unnamed protein product [Closterium sp. NIES-64]|nr:unnamed protein product [Closterium sp. NIES-64]